MPDFAPALERLITAFTSLPGVGRKTAQRFAFHLLKSPKEEVVALAAALTDLRESLRECAVCHFITDAERCAICTDPQRDPTTVCVVESAANVVAIERTRAFRGLYHVLGGVLSPLHDVGPEDLQIRDLVDRVALGTIREALLATGPTVEGEATAGYLSRLLTPLGVRITRPAQGLPAGADLEFTDDLTLRRALEGRLEY